MNRRGRMFSLLLGHRALNVEIVATLVSFASAVRCRLAGALASGLLRVMSLAGSLGSRRLLRLGRAGFVTVDGWLAVVGHGRRRTRTDRVKKKKG